MINDKIRADLEERGKYSLATTRRILGALEASPDEVFTLRELCNRGGSHSGSFWAAAYYLAAKGKIGFSDRKYHVWGSSDLNGYASKIRCVVWHKDHKINGIAVRPQWASYQSKTTQPSLFGDNIKSLSDAELLNLIERAQKIRFERLLDERYRGSLEHLTSPIKDVLTEIGVADPVALVHADERCAFLTLTETNAMPIQITFAMKDGNAIAQTMTLSHLTIHGAPAISMIQKAYKRNGASE